MIREFKQDTNKHLKELSEDVKKLIDVHEN